MIERSVFQNGCLYHVFKNEDDATRAYDFMNMSPEYGERITCFGGYMNAIEITIIK